MRRGVFKGLVILGLLFAATVCVAQTPADIQAHASCKYCGMDRQQFAHSRMQIEYEDGAAVGTCSIHCAAIDLANNIDKTPKGLLVGDYGTKKLIDAEKAVWVIGGNKPGVMTKRAKWAFENKDQAEKFIQENGGSLATFDQAMKTSYEDMYEDTKMIRDRRKAKRMQQPSGQPKQ
jgi:copper chaperone NosL